MSSFVLCRDAHGEPCFTGEPRLSLADGTRPDLQVILVSLFFLNSETRIGTLDHISEIICYRDICEFEHWQNRIERRSFMNV